jgi:hypothetical protein
MINTDFISAQTSTAIDAVYFAGANQAADIPSLNSFQFVTSLVLDVTLQQKGCSTPQLHYAARKKQHCTVKSIVCATRYKLR